MSMRQWAILPRWFLSLTALSTHGRRLAAVAAAAAAATAVIAAAAANAAAAAARAAAPRKCSFKVHGLVVLRTKLFQNSSQMRSRRISVMAPKLSSPRSHAFRAPTNGLGEPLPSIM